MWKLRTEILIHMEENKQVTTATTTAMTAISHGTRPCQYLRWSPKWHARKTKRKEKSVRYSFALWTGDRQLSGSNKQRQFHQQQYRHHNKQRTHVYIFIIITLWMYQKVFMMRALTYLFIFIFSSSVCPFRSAIPPTGFAFVFIFSFFFCNHMFARVCG